MRVQLWWQSLAKRERKLMIYGLSLLFAVSFVFWFWQPLNDRLDNKQQQLIHERKLLLWMRHVSPTIIENKNKFTKSILHQLKHSLLTAHINATMIQADYRHITLKISRIPYHKFVNWITRFEHHVPLTIAAVDIAERHHAIQVKMVFLTG